MNLLKAKLEHLVRHIGFKITIYAAATYASIVFISLIITFVAFLSLGHFKTQIENSILKHSGYIVKFGNLHSGLSDNYTPEVIIDNLTIQSPEHLQQSLAIKQVRFALSYATIWHLSPIFDHFIVSGSYINITCLKNGNISINGFIIDTHKKTNSKKSSFDFEKFVLQQKFIQLSNVNIGFQDEGKTIPAINVNNIIISLQYFAFNKHEFKTTFGNNNKNKPLDLILTWQGNTISKPEEWKKATLKIRSYTRKDSFINTISKYIPDINTFDNFSSENIVEATLENGKLTYLYANFNVKHLALMIPNGLEKIDFPKLGGTVKIILTDPNNYSINADNLTISTKSGYVFDNKNITGNYVVKKNGHVKLIDTDLDKFNNIFKFIPNLNKVKISGILNIVQFSWIGDIFKPDDIKFNTTFSNLSIISHNDYIPSIDNLNGDIEVTKHKGHLNLALTNSTLNYEYMFLKLYKFKSLTTKVNWQESAAKSFVFNIESTDIQSVDFNGRLFGKYTYIPKTAGYLELHASIDRMEAHKIGNYLPKILGMPTLKWINSGVIGGYANNGKIELNGNLADFPFSKNNGIFSIDADIVKGKLSFADGWPTVDNIDGKFQLRNQKIIILGKSATSVNNQVESVTAVIPDMTADKILLSIDGSAHGQTSNFLKYLVTSPLNNILGKFPEKVTATGVGNMKVHLNVPFSDPTKTQVQGTFTFKNNNLKINLPVPELSDVNGDLNFFESGIVVKNISATALSSNLNLNATTAADGSMHFNVSSTELNYGLASEFYLPFLNPVISGQAQSNITFIIGSHGLDNLQLQSNLVGVKLDTPKPLDKAASESAPINVTLTPDADGSKLNFTYGNLLEGRIILNSEGNLEKADISSGFTKISEQFSNLSKVNLYLKTNDLNVIPWMDTISRILNHPQNQGESATPITEALRTDEHIRSKNSNSPFPLNVFINTNNLFVGNTNFYNLKANVIVRESDIVFNLNNTLTNGYGQYILENKTLNIRLYKFNILKPTDNNETKTIAITKSSSPNWINFARVNLESATTKKTKPVSAEDMPLEHDIAGNIVIEKSETGVPTTTLNIDELQYENNNLGKLYLKLVPSGKNLVFKDNSIIGQSFTLNFSGVNSCFNCVNSFSDFSIHAKINNLGDLLERLDYGKIVSKGDGTIDTTMQWNGSVADFSLKKANIGFNILINKGSFLKVSTGSILGKILGLINLQTITNFIKLDFGQVFSDGFYFDTLEIHGTSINNIIDLKSIIMQGPLASVKMFGKINMNSQTVQLHLIIVPHLSTSVAVGVAVATGPVVGPVAGIATYAAEELFDNPFSKLFSLRFHVTGALDKPNIEKEDVTKQIVKNVSSTIGQ